MIDFSGTIFITENCSGIMNDFWSPWIWNIVEGDVENAMEDGTTLYSETVSNSDWSAKDGINTTNTSAVSNINELESEILIPLYSIIFFLSIVGNTLVIVTLAQNRRMRTVTNILLLNLVSEKFLIATRQALYEDQ